MLKSLITFVSLLFLSSCLSNDLIKPIRGTDAAVNSGKRPNVALMLPLSGSYSDIGDDMLKAAELAMEELKVTNINLEPVDIGSDAGNESLIAKKIDTKHYDLILGPVFSEHTKIVYSHASKHNIPIISFSNDISLLGHDNLFLIGVMPQKVVNRVLEYAELNGYSKVFALLPENRYGAFIEGELKKAHEYKVLGIGKYQRLPSGELGEVGDGIAEIKSAMVQEVEESGSSEGFVLLIPEGAEVVKLIASEMSGWAQENRIRFKLVGSNQWDDEKIVSEKYLQGAWFASAPDEHLKRFEQRFYERYGTKPFKISAVAYDAVALATVVAGKGDIIGEICNSHGFRGSSGIFRFSKDGRNEREFSIFEIQGGKLITIDDAGSNFQ